VLICAPPSRAHTRRGIPLTLPTPTPHAQVAVTLIKYTPQLLLNFQRRSTDGWAIDQVTPSPMH
jgi:hypothetical protein